MGFIAMSRCSFCASTGGCARAPSLSSLSLVPLSVLCGVSGLSLFLFHLDFIR